MRPLKYSLDVPILPPMAKSPVKFNVEGAGRLTGVNHLDISD
ncbi:MAG: hypothetical protein R2766_01070 [Saprospiraceae bacterium]